MQRYLAIKNFGRPVGLIVVDERSAAAHDVLHVRKRCAGPVVLVILAAYRECDAVTGGHDDARRPDLDIELDGLARCEGLKLVVRMVWPVRQTQCRIEFTM